MAVVTATHVEPTSAFYAAAHDLRLDAATLDAINAVNIAVGEFALALECDDPRRGALLDVQDGLDRLWSASGGPEHERFKDVAARREFRARLGVAFDALGHRGSSIFRDRLAAAYGRVAS